MSKLFLSLNVIKVWESRTATIPNLLYRTEPSAMCITKHLLWTQSTSLTKRIKQPQPCLESKETSSLVDET